MLLWLKDSQGLSLVKVHIYNSGDGVVLFCCSLEGALS